MSRLRAFTATFALALALTFSACDSQGATDPAVRPSPTPALDGIGMVGGGGRTADGSEPGGTTSAPVDTVTVVTTP
ncbi:MAG: hypothetical protein AB1941_00945 [Gemmatimonadota bacterium]